MNCQHAESQIFAARDAPLGAADAALLEQHLAECPHCRSLADQLAAAAAVWQKNDAKVTPPEPLPEWHAVRRRIRESDTHSRTTGLPSWRRLIRRALPLAAALAIAVNYWKPTIIPEAVPPSSQVVQHDDWVEMHEHFAFVAHAEYVETEDEEISPFVYVDEESGWLIVWATDVTDTPSI